MPDNRQVLDNLEAYVHDKLSISRSLHDRLGLTENSLLGAQTVTVATVQSDQLTTRIPDNSPNNTEIVSKMTMTIWMIEKNTYIR